jgi:hypothetical protein
MARGPASSTKDRTQRAPGNPTARHRPILTGQGSAPAQSTTTQTIASHTNQSAAAIREGFRSIREQYATQGGVSGIGWDIAGQQIACDIGVRQFEKLDEYAAFVTSRKIVPLQMAQQQEVELFHAAPAAPPDSSQELTLHDGNRRRSGAVHEY